MRPQSRLLETGRIPSAGVVAWLPAAAPSCPCALSINAQLLPVQCRYTQHIALSKLFHFCSTSWPSGSRSYGSGGTMRGPWCTRTLGREAGTAARPSKRQTPPNTSRTQPQTQRNPTNTPSVSSCLCRAKHRLSSECDCNHAAAASFSG